MSEPASQSPLRLIAILLGSIFTIEVGIHGLITLLLPERSIDALIDSALLIAVVFPLLLVFVVQPLNREIQERKQAEHDVRAARDQLELRVQQRTAELELRNREVGLLAEMSGLLHACATAADAYRVVARTGERLFPEAAGVVYAATPDQDRLAVAIRWGGFADGDRESVVARSDCSALLSGRGFAFERSAQAAPCAHAASPPPTRSLCVPINARGETLGILHLRHDDSVAAFNRALSEDLATSVAEQLGLALTNLSLLATLHSLSIHDPLTGLLNRRYLDESFERELHRVARSEDSMGVVMLDLDHFKQLNDTFGHAAGDLVLREVSEILRSQVRASDLACRYGGEEFIIILPQAALDMVRERTENLCRRVRELRLEYLGASLGSITISAGIAMFPGHGTTAEALLAAADRALYAAKAEGRDRVSVASTIA